MHRFALIGGLSFVALLASCGIGPKQDDPANLDPVPVSDTGTGVLDDAAGGLKDDDSGGPTSAVDGGGEAMVPADAMVDASSEVCPDGGVPLHAVGPWNEGKDCWKESFVYECAASVDGGTAFTCYARVSTGELFLATTTQVPTGSDYRACTDAERMRVKSTPDLCKK